MTNQHSAAGRVWGGLQHAFSGAWSLGWQVCLALYWMLIAAATHLPADQIPDLNELDKVMHWGAFGVLGGLWRLAKPRRASGWGWCLGGTVVLLLYAGLDEISQPLVGRTADLRDFAADLFGLATGIWATHGILALLLTPTKPAHNSMSTETAAESLAAATEQEMSPP